MSGRTCGLWIYFKPDNDNISGWAVAECVPWGGSDERWETAGTWSHAYLLWPSCGYHINAFSFSIFLSFFVVFHCFILGRFLSIFILWTFRNVYTLQRWCGLMAAAESRGSRRTRPAASGWIAMPLRLFLRSLRSIFLGNLFLIILRILLFLDIAPRSVWSSLSFLLHPFRFALFLFSSFVGFLFLLILVFHVFLRQWS